MTTDHALNTNAFGESYLPHINGSTFADHKAETVFARRTDPDLFREDCLHLVIGSDSGLLIDYIQQQGVPAGAKYLFIEPQDILPTIQSLRPAIAQQPPVGLCLPSDWMKLAEPFDLETYVLKRQVLIHPSIATLDTAKDIYQPIVERIYNELDAAAYTIKAPYAGGSMIEMKLANLSENIIPVKNLFNTFQGGTAIVLGAGPSLDMHIPWIQKNREQLIILAASRLCRRLYFRYKIAPDIVVSVDSQEVNYQQSRWLYELPPETILAHSNHVSPKLIAQWHGRSCYIGDLFPWQSADNIPDNMQEEGGPTVSNSALVLAGKMGFSTILLSGVDLCSPVGSASHTGSLQIKKNTDYIHDVPTYDGQIAKTNVNMLHAANRLGDQAMEATTATVINLSPFACKIDGIQHVATENMQLNDDTNHNWQEKITFNSSPIRLAHNRRMLDNLKSTLLDIKKMHELAVDAIKLNKKLYKQDKDGNYNHKAKRKLDRIKEVYNTELNYLAIPVRKLAIDHFIGAMTTRNVEVMNEGEREQLGHKYYSAFKKGSASLKEFVESSIERIDNRIKEDSASPELNTIFSQWDKDQQYLRANVWQHWHTEHYQQLNEDTKQQFSDFIDRGMQTRDRGYIDHFAFVGPKQSASWYVREHIYQAYHQNDITSLQTVPNLLADSEISSIRRQELQTLTELCLCLLQNKNEQVLENYIAVNHSDLDIKLYLNIINSALSISNNIIAKNAFQRICNLERKFMPEYANWLKAIGEIAEAADIYTEYLKFNPEDLSIWQLLAELYQSAGENELASSVYQFILELDPENTQAKLHIP